MNVSTKNQSMILVDDIEEGEVEQVLNIPTSKTRCGDKMIWGPTKSGALKKNEKMGESS